MKGILRDWAFLFAWVGAFIAYTALIFLAIVNGGQGDWWVAAGCLAGAVAMATLWMSLR